MQKAVAPMLLSVRQECISSVCGCQEVRTTQQQACRHQLLAFCWLTEAHVMQQQACGCQLLG